MLMSTTLLSIFLAIAYGQEQEIWSSTMNSVENNGDGWSVSFGRPDRCQDINDGNNIDAYCLLDGNNDKSCFQMRGSCTIQRTDPISTNTFDNIKLKYFIVESSGNQGLENTDIFQISYSCTNDDVFLPLTSYQDGIFPFVGGGNYALSDIITISLSSAQCANNANGINIKFQNVATQKQDVVFLDQVSIVGTPIIATPQPTTDTPGPTPAPTSDTPAPTSSTPGPTAITQAPTSDTPAPTASTSGPTGIPTSDTPAPTPVPTPNTPAPTSNTPEPTPIPTSNTPAPTSSTPGPTAVTPAPTAPTSPSSTDPCESDPSRRHRRAYHTLSPEEQQLFMDGMMDLGAASNGDGGNQLEDLVDSHVQIFSGQAHGTSAFLPWHRWYLWELEELIRALPDPKYKCWTLPYWDICYENDQATQAIPWWILTSTADLGGDGVGRRNCIGDPVTWEYNGGCITRNSCNPFTDNGCPYLRDYEAFYDFVSATDRYGNVDNCDSGAQTGGFRYGLEYGAGLHPNMHCNIGGGGTTLCTAASPADPIFWLLHGMIDYIWSFWQACNGYDAIDPYTYFSCCLETDLDQCCVPNEKAYCGQFSDTYIGGELEFPVLEDRPYSHANDSSHNNDIVDLYDLNQWGISYDYGDFDPAEAASHCGRVLNTDWFYDADGDNRRRLGAERRENRVKTKARKDKEKIAEKVRQGKTGKMTKEESKLIAKLTCEYDEKRFNRHCELPVSFINCDDIPNGKNNDIDISLDELVERIDGSECMVATRRRFYDWAKMTKSLRSLCDGVYDQFCDKEMLKTRMISIGNARQKQESETEHKLIESKVITFPDIGHNNNNNNNNVNINYYGIDNVVDILRKNVMIIGGILMILSVVIILCCYTKIKKKHYIKYSKVKSDEIVDVDI